VICGSVDLEDHLLDSLHQVVFNVSSFAGSAPVDELCL